MKSAETSSSLKTKNAKEAAKYLGVSLDVLRDLVNAKKVRVHKPGIRKWYFLEEELREDFIKL